jgi:energy-coupling factor transporter ATP-binding protein EcfA2
MRYTKFVITNFKGIKRTEIDLSYKPKGSVYTLVGLNESGKTTILEAINAFSPERDGVAHIFPDVIRQFKPKDLVPKNMKANFTGDITIAAHLELSSQDIKKILWHCAKVLSLDVDPDSITATFTIERTLEFKNSDYLQTQVAWWLYPKVKAKGETIFQEIEAETPEWDRITDYIQEMIPPICYFPTFLFDFPERIYLSNPPASINANVNQYYVQIVQDILDYLGDGMDIGTHILARVEKTVKANHPWNVATFWASDYKEQIDHVMLKIGSALSKVIFERWNEIFGTRPYNKSIDVDWGIDSTLDGPRSIYLRFQIKDANSRFDISERSLGFRWFFCFLLFTQFRASRRSGSGAVFIFDEPASNLHSKAQQKLLESFSRITHQEHVIIYSTHSHYMINPRWLENAFIIVNKGIDYDDELVIDHPMLAKPIDIVAVKYRDFVGQQSDKATYYQPILDALDFIPSELELGKTAIFVEGKNDFYMLKYFDLVQFTNKEGVCIIPSSGANDMGPLISLYLGWGQQFAILLDADKAGQVAKERYENEFLLREGTVLLLSDIDEGWAGKKMEGLLGEADIKVVASWCGKAKPGKADVGRFFQEKLATLEKVELSADLVESARKILMNFREKFDSL